MPLIPLVPDPALHCLVESIGKIPDTLQGLLCIYVFDTANPLGTSKYSVSLIHHHLDGILQTTEKKHTGKKKGKAVFTLSNAALK